MPLSLLSFGHLPRAFSLPFSEDCSPSETPLEKTKFSYAHGQQLETDSGLGVGEVTYILQICLLSEFYESRSHRKILGVSRILILKTIKFSYHILCSSYPKCVSFLFQSTWSSQRQECPYHSKVVYRTYEMSSHGFSSMPKEGFETLQT